MPALWCVRRPDGGAFRFAFQTECKRCRGKRDKWRMRGARSNSKRSPRGPRLDRIVSGLPALASVVSLHPARIHLGREWRDAADALVAAVAQTESGRSETDHTVKQFEIGAPRDAANRACIGFYPAHAFTVAVDRSQLAPDAQVGDVVRLESLGATTPKLSAADNRAWSVPTHLGVGRLEAFYALRTYALAFRLSGGARSIYVPIAVLGAAVFDDNRCHPLPLPPPPPPPPSEPVRATDEHTFFWSGPPSQVPMMWPAPAIAAPASVPHSAVHAEAGKTVSPLILGEAPVSTTSDRATGSTTPGPGASGPEVSTPRAFRQVVATGEIIRLEAQVEELEDAAKTRETRIGQLTNEVERLRLAQIASDNRRNALEIENKRLQSALEQSNSQAAATAAELAALRTVSTQQTDDRANLAARNEVFRQNSMGSSPVSGPR